MAALASKVLCSAVRGYQRGISPWLAPRCRFSPSCSAYALATLEHVPLPRALGQIAWRLLRCQPFAAGGVDPPRVRPTLRAQGAHR